MNDIPEYKLLYLVKYVSFKNFIGQSRRQSRTITGTIQTPTIVVSLW